MSSRSSPKSRRDFLHFTQITTRWNDNDAYRHVNNVSYYSFFDTALNEFLILSGILDVEKSEVIGLIVNSKCDYFSPLTFPECIDIGLIIARLGNSSVTYSLAAFREGKDQAAAQGEMVHVYVDRMTGRPVRLPQDMLSQLSNLQNVNG